MRAEEGQQKRARSIDSNSLIVPPGAHSLPCHHQGVYYTTDVVLSISSYMELTLVLNSSRCFSTQLSPPSFTFLIVFFLFLIICCVWKIFNRFFSFEIYLKPVPIFYAFNYSSIQSTDNQGLLPVQVPVSSILYSSLFLQLCCNLINAS
jgi:hypothetical protein